MWPIDETLTMLTTPGQNKPGINDNKRAFHTPQISRTKVSPLDAI